MSKRMEKWFNAVNVADDAVDAAKGCTYATETVHVDAPSQCERRLRGGGGGEGCGCGWSGSGCGEEC